MSYSYRPKKPGKAQRAAARLKARQQKFMPVGIPRWVRCYDNGGKTCDRYTVVYTGRTSNPSQDGQRWYPYVGMSEHPFYPQGFGQHGEHPGSPVDVCYGPKKVRWPPAVGRKCHLGTRIKFGDLPKDCQTLVLRDYKEIWRLT